MQDAACAAFNLGVLNFELGRPTSSAIHFLICYQLLIDVARTPGHITGPSEIKLSSQCLRWIQAVQLKVRKTSSGRNGRMKNVPATCSSAEPQAISSSRQCARSFTTFKTRKDKKKIEVDLLPNNINSDKPAVKGPGSPKGNEFESSSSLLIEFTYCDDSKS
eukprot:snap_masked-scaffold_7-processed-gene-19.57-mRNA-1 protein AED:1.00 eAED:1.00 QI:0/-1/0/0/-1/1/1/0/161